MLRPSELTLELVPDTRYDVIDVVERVRDRYGDELTKYSRALYCSFHTTAGYFEQSHLARMRYSRHYLDPFIRVFQKLFPAGASYRHDQLDLRTELSEEQRAVEPKNADSHLAFIGAGLRNCATYVDGPSSVYFVDLDGVVPEGSRRRRTTVLAYEHEREVDEREVGVPTSPHPVDSVNLRDPSLEVFADLEEWVSEAGVEHGRLDLALAPEEHHSGLTVNEYETLLMKHDLPEVLEDPVRFMVEKGRNALRDPWAIPNKTLGYARYDLVQLFNEALDKLNLSESVLEGIIARCLALPATRILALKPSVSLPVLRGQVRCGTYQSPILVQWQKSARQTRKLAATLIQFE